SMASFEPERKRKLPETAGGSEEAAAAAAAAAAADEEDEEEERWVGPLPGEAVQAKKRRGNGRSGAFARLPLLRGAARKAPAVLPWAGSAAVGTDFIITASHDGHVKFWKKIEEGIEFVKHFRSHLGENNTSPYLFLFFPLSTLCCSYYPGQCEWVYCPGDAISSVATSEKSTGKIFIYDGRGNNQPLHVFDKLHTSSLTQIRLNPVYKVVVSSDKSGMIEYWTGTPHEYKFPKNVNWDYKTDTDLYEFAKCKAYPSSISFSPDGKKMATLGSDRKVRIFRFLTGKLMRVFDESLSMFTELQQMRQQLPDMEFGRRMAVERELEKVDAVRLINIIFDETGHFVLYGTIKATFSDCEQLTVVTPFYVLYFRCIRILGKQENIRVMQLALFQGVAKKHRAAITIEMKASENPVLQNIQADPTVICTAFKKNRFYM
ncbi:PPWD1 protein, partial [Nyctibius bracteatus]|nr:PPWD1 protein [Nyctibius bracteatus]